MPPAWTLVPPLWRLKILKIFLVSMQQRLMVLLSLNCLLLLTPVRTLVPPLWRLKTLRIFLLHMQQRLLFRLLALLRGLLMRFPRPRLLMISFPRFRQTS
jgi:hypothetical protein